MLPIEELDCTGKVPESNPTSNRRLPLVLRGLAGAWPLTRAGLTSMEQLTDYLSRYDQKKALGAMIGDPREQGRFFYNRDMTKFNFKRMQGYLSDALGILKASRDKPGAPGFYIGSTSIPDYFPGLEEDCRLPFLSEEVAPNIWIGNRTSVAVHDDKADNIACVAVGRRRFTLFPPDQEPNLYIAHDKPSPAGRPISLVNMRQPDFESFPRFSSALETVMGAELGPGDALFIPEGWWHGVEALEDVNILVNFWWEPDQTAA